MSEDKPKWFAHHEEEDKKHFEERPTKEEMKQIVEDALVNFFTTKGRITKNVLVTIALVVGALTVIGGGAKWILALAGFGIIKN